ncbi:MAG: heavy-metal-associated domain-containing protein [Deltaproteobacteria bacterium]|nr:heavy-metal-associated domain-containing protein [Deltaproteobacteria bacterium]
MKTTTIAIQGMTCGGCVSAVTRALKAVPGVQDVQVTLQPGQAQVTFDESQTDDSGLKSVVEDAGYDVG